MPIEALLFDLDGTLADTARDLGGALNRLLQEEGRPPLPLESLRPHVSGGAGALLRAGFGLTPSDPAFAEYRQRFLDQYESAICRETVLFPGIADLLVRLDDRKIPWGVVTNKMERFTRQVVSALGLELRAACVISGDSAARLKPAPDPILLACTQAGVLPAATLYIGDDLRDIQAGKAAGTGTIAVRWGYLGTDSNIATWGADRIIDEPQELLDLLG